MHYRLYFHKLWKRTGVLSNILDSQYTQAWMISRNQKSISALSGTNTIATSEKIIDFNFDLGLPYGPILVLININSHNRATSWTDSGFFWRCSRATPEPAITAYVVTPNASKHPHCRSFRTATIYDLASLWILNSYPRAPYRMALFHSNPPWFEIGLLASCSEK